MGVCAGVGGGGQFMGYRGGTGGGMGGVRGGDGGSQGRGSIWLQSGGGGAGGAGVGCSLWMPGVHFRWQG